MGLATHPSEQTLGSINVDGSIPLSHEFKEPDYQANEHLTDEEVEAIVKRYGEAQSGGNTQPTIKDVAEALHVEPEVVSQLLSDVRGAKTQEDLKSRLDSLESENSELRERAEKSDYHANQMWSEYSAFRPQPAKQSYGAPRAALILAIIFGSMFLFRGLARGAGSISVIWILVAVFGLIFILKRLRCFKR